MAKKVANLSVGFRGNVQWFNVHGFLERNSRANSFGNPLSDLNEMIRPLGDGENDLSRRTTGDGLVARLIDGWDGLQQEFVECTIPTAEEIDAAIAQRRERLAAWQGSDNDNLKFLAQWVKDFWFPSGEPCPILAIVNMSYRRTYAAAAVAFARYRRGIDKTGGFEIPVLVKEYANPLAAYMRHIDENLGKDAGRKDYTPLDYVRVAYDIHRLGGNEAQLRRYGKVGEAQRAFAAVTLNARLPKVHLYDRLMLPPTSLDNVTGKLPYVAPADDPKGIGSYVPYRGMSKEDLRALLDDKEPGHASIKDAPTRVLTPQVLEEYLQSVTLGGRKVASWNANDNKKMLEAPSDVAKFIFWCASTGKRDELNAFVAKHGAAIDAAATADGFDLFAYKENGGMPPAKKEAAGKSKSKSKSK